MCGVGPDRPLFGARGCTFPAELFHPVVVGHPEVLRRALTLVGTTRTVVEVDGPQGVGGGTEVLACWNPSSGGRWRARAGESRCPGRCRPPTTGLVAATRAGAGGEIDAIVTAPLNKYALHQAGLDFPGPTEILAHECGVAEYAMMLYLPPAEADVAGVRNPNALSVAHATLHTSIASVPRLSDGEPDPRDDRARRSFPAADRPVDAAGSASAP